MMISILYGSNVSFKLNIDEQYQIQSNLIKEDIKESKTILTFDCGKCEIVFESEIKRVVYKDGHQIIYFPNGDIFLMPKKWFYLKRMKLYRLNF